MSGDVAVGVDYQLIFASFTPQSRRYHSSLLPPVGRVILLPYGESSSSRMKGYAPLVWGVMLLPYGESSRMGGHAPPVWRIIPYGGLC